MGCFPLLAKAWNLRAGELYKALFRAQLECAYYIGHYMNTEKRYNTGNHDLMVFEKHKSLVILGAFGCVPAV